MKSYLLALGLVVLATACQHEPDNRHEALRPEFQEKLAMLPALSPARATTLLQSQCYNCHDPSSASHDEMLAPPLAGIKHRYGTLYPERDIFLQRMTDFVLHPSQENAVMRGPVRRFGLMPPTALEPDTILALVAYIHDYQLPVPAWFPAHFQEEHGTTWK
jgi:hypothetical protein